MFRRQLLNVIEWNETRDDVLFWKWRNKEIKKGSRLIIRPGQDAIFIYNGKIEGIFTDEGNYEIETEIVPFLSSLKGFKFGFNSALRAEVLFVNTKEFLVKWGTKKAINIPSQRMPGGIPIRCFGVFTVKISDYIVLIDKIAGVKQEFTVDDVKQRVLALLDQLLMKWISREGKNMFNLQANAYEIAQGIKADLDMELLKIGLTITDFNISSFSYPEQIQKIIEKNASYEMVGDVGRYQQIGVVEAMDKNSDGAVGNMAQAGIGMAMGMEMAKQMTKGAQTNTKSAVSSGVLSCAGCGAQLPDGARFCISCGAKVDDVADSPVGSRFCHNCGQKLQPEAKFCSGCGVKLA
ncbi:MAG TPA: zinc-ribbon domain-containing protein [Clostridiales bacterium]|nr:zinc-ribbon domain-containing protein [Clostridiales bacterium]